MYSGFTDELERRIDEHKRKVNPKSFTAKYNCNKLVYFEKFEDFNDAFNQEKQLKRYKRQWKENLINQKSILNGIKY